MIPDDVDVTVTRHYGETAAEKSNELLMHMGIAVLSVSLLILLMLGWRESVVVLIAIPATLALTLLVFYLYGYTLNRITLFALIFSIGILVDDAIVVVENIYRHLQQGDRSPDVAAVEGVDEVGNPTILATWAVIAAILPMAFVGGLMGPYMRPIPVGASAAMVFSLVVAFIVTPWAAIRAARKGGGGTTDGARRRQEDRMTPRLYRRLMGRCSPPAGAGCFPRRDRRLLLGALDGAGRHRLGEGQDAAVRQQERVPAGRRHARGHAARADRARWRARSPPPLRDEPEVTDYQIYAGTAAPFNFNGLVRHYFLRQGPNVADIQVNLLPKHGRDAASHDIAKRVRASGSAIAERATAHDRGGRGAARTAGAADAGGRDLRPRSEARSRSRPKRCARSSRRTTGVVDVDWYVEATRPKATAS